MEGHVCDHFSEKRKVLGIEGGLRIEVEKE